MAALTKNSGWFLISYDVIPRGGHNGNGTGNKLHCMKNQERKPRMHQWRLLSGHSSDWGGLINLNEIQQK